MSRESRACRRPWALPACGWLLYAAALLLLLYAFDRGTVPRDRLFHQEAIYPAALYRDLGHWSTWSTPYAPYFVPDVALFFLLMALTGAAAPTNAVASGVYAYAAAQFTLLILASRWLFRGVLVHDPPAARRAGRLTVLAGAALALALTFGFPGRDMLIQVFAAAFHGGALVLAVAGLATLVAILNLPERRAGRREAALLALLFSICVAGALSDRLLLVIFVAPALPALLVVAWFGRARARLARAAAVVAGGGLLGLLSIPWINAAGGIAVATPASIDPSAVVDALLSLPRHEPAWLSFVVDRLFEGLGTVYRAWWLLFVVGTLLLLLASLGERGSPRIDPASRRNLGFFAAFTLLSFVSTAAATCYFAVGQYGVKVSFHGVLFVNRYLLALYIIPLLAPALYLPVLLGRRRALKLEAAVLVLLAVLVLAQAARTDFRGAFPAYRPADVACLDAQAARHGWRYGLAFFSEARRVNVWTGEGLYVDQLTAGLEPTTWIASRRRAGEAAGYDFVITRSLQRRDDVVTRFGRPDRVADCHGMGVFVYEEPRSFPAVADAARATSATATSSSAAPTGTSSTPRPGSPP
jgi:hypothetical protein